jgi:hypothetical protein
MTPLANHAAIDHNSLWQDRALDTAGNARLMSNQGNIIRDKPLRYAPDG